MVRVLLQSLILLATITWLTACELSEEEKKALADSLLTNPPEFVPPPPPVSNNFCVTETHYQPDAEIVRKIDILFITDTSASLDVERPAIVDGIDAFTKELPSNVDFQVGVMLGHGSKSKWTGKLWQRGSEPLFLSSKAQTIDQIRTHLKYKMQTTATDSYSDGGEEGLYSLSRLFDTDRLTEAKTSGFLRDDAALAVVFIADENDICAIYPAGVTPVKDNDNSEVPAFKRDCGGITAESVLNKIKAVKKDKPLLVSGIVYNEQSKFTPEGENEIGYGYLDIIRLNNGLAIDLAGGRFHQGLSQIGQLASKKLRLITEYTLKNQNVDDTTFRVFVDRQKVDFSYVKELNQVHLTGYAGVEHSEVLINYCILPPNDGDDPNNDGTVESPIWNEFDPANNL